MVNLEQAVSDSQYIEEKCTLYTGSYALKKLKELKINAVNLAHNHIQDKGLDAIAETIYHLDSFDIKNYGAGVNAKAASQPYWVTESIAILGYCDFEKQYLRQVEIAEENKPGVNPLRLNKIKSDLDNLPVGKKAIIYFHWGMEHVWLPPGEDIDLAKLILEDERVITIIGMHSHRAQGVVNHAGKQAFMCLGNFLFPNFCSQTEAYHYYFILNHARFLRVDLRIILGNLWKYDLLRRNSSSLEVLTLSDPMAFHSHQLVFFLLPFIS